jgi:hypothetical protein
MVGKKAGGLAILRIAGTWEIILRIDGNGGDLSCGPVAQMFNPKD